MKESKPVECEQELTRQGTEYRMKHWTKEVTDEDGDKCIVNPKYCMKKPVKAKKGS